MPGHNRSALETLRLELKLLELGPYRVSTPGRPVLGLQDSPSCPRYQVDSCANGALIECVPYAGCFEPVLCHHIRLDKAQETDHRLYRTGTQPVLEEAVGDWLTTSINKLQRVGTEPWVGLFETQPRSARERKPV